MNNMLMFIAEQAQGAGKILLEHFRQPLAQSSKSDVVDIVTAADQASEAYLLSALRPCYANDIIIGEESGAQGGDWAGKFVWHIDPLDGTVNFANGIAHFAVSIARADANGEPTLGVVYQPVTDELFCAARGEGATLNGQPIRVSEKTRLVESILASGFAYDRRTNPDNNTAQWSAFVPQVRGMRRFGSAALDLCYVACGRFDGYWERSLKSWDAMAGMLIVQEAGGIVTDYTGGARPQDGADGRYVAANPHLHPIMLDILARSYGKG